MTLPRWQEGHRPPLFQQPPRAKRQACTRNWTAEGGHPQLFICLHLDDCTTAGGQKDTSKSEHPSRSSSSIDLIGDWPFLQSQLGLPAAPRGSLIQLCQGFVHPHLSPCSTLSWESGEWRASRFEVDFIKLPAKLITYIMRVSLICKVALRFRLGDLDDDDPRQPPQRRRWWWWLWWLLLLLIFYYHGCSFTSGRTSIAPQVVESLERCNLHFFFSLFQSQYTWGEYIITWKSCWQVRRSSFVFLGKCLYWGLRRKKNCAKHCCRLQMMPWRGVWTLQVLFGL